VATDGGVENEQWQRLGSGLPNVPVMQTKISPTRRLVAATYGRNVWALDISGLANRHREDRRRYSCKFHRGLEGTSFTC